jgi:hypothetical protein
MIFISAIYNKIRRLLFPYQYTKEYYIKSLRNEFMLWGYDLSNVTDEQIEKRVIEIGKIIANTGVSSNQAAKNLSIIK